MRWMNKKKDFDYKWILANVLISACFVVAVEIIAAMIGWFTFGVAIIFALLIFLISMGILSIYYQYRKK